MSRFDRSKLKAMFGGKGFYIALAVCLLAAGAIGYLTLFASTTPAMDPAPVIEVKPSPVTPAPTEPVIRTEPIEVPVQQPETVIEEPVELLPQVISPLDGTTVTVFSMTELMYDETMADWRTHDGVDIKAEEGDAVKTAADGTVKMVRYDDLMGVTVVIAHADGYETQYSSLQQEPPVEQGKTVKAGDIIGRVGSTAAAEGDVGPHLHFSVSKDGKVVNPSEYVKQ